MLNQFIGCKPIEFYPESGIYNQLKFHAEMGIDNLEYYANLYLHITYSVEITKPVEMCLGKENSILSVLYTQDTCIASSVSQPVAEEVFKNMVEKYNRQTSEDFVIITLYAHSPEYENRRAFRQHTVMMGD